MTLDFVLIIAATKYLRSSLKTAETLPKWNSILKYMMYGSIAFIVVELLFSSSQVVTVWVAHFTLVMLVYILYSEVAFKPAKPLLVAIAPYIIISIFAGLVKLLSKSLYDDWNGLLKTATLFAVIWGAGTWIITNNQKKALEKERIKTKEEEQNNKVITAMKAQLEVQVAERTLELTKQKEELQLTLDELKATQSQLIQSEKMASLGELTAGIAHEIQNPLNFVNNFAEVNTELIDELEAEADKGNTQEIKAIVKNIKENEQKISHHGKRADAIVKGMLQHSRKNTGQKELTDINALCDEYLRLSYHGLRAKDKSFNADFKTEFDESIGKINIVPQDIGRLLLNLINNAFYAVNEKKKSYEPSSMSYEPLVLIQTKRLNDKIEIRVEDNGNGIPQNIIDKIFQPFFTTKPTGQGTGLGLSLTYDIIKAHDGEIKVKTMEGEGTSFIIQLPINKIS